MSKTIALLGQPNSGKSSLFNGLTGSHQHVGNWPGKTVEHKEGVFTFQGEEYHVIDLPGSYSLSAGSEEEVITTDYIASGKADLVAVLVDSSQLERSLYMFTDFIGINIPVILILSGTAFKAIRDYEDQLKRGVNPVFKSADIELEQKTDFWN